MPLHPCALAGSLFRHDGSPANPLLIGRFTCLFLDLFLRRNERQQADSLKACYEVGTICEAAGVIFIAENGEGAGGTASEGAARRKQKAGSVHNRERLSEWIEARLTGKSGG